MKTIGSQGLRLLLSILALAACETPVQGQESAAAPPVTPDELRQIDLRQSKRCPVIDIHIHTFNSVDLPLRNIVAARKHDKLPVIGYLLPVDFDRDVAAYLLKVTNDAELAKRAKRPMKTYRDLEKENSGQPVPISKVLPDQGVKQPGSANADSLTIRSTSGQPETKSGDDFRRYAALASPVRLSAFSYLLSLVLPISANDKKEANRFLYFATRPHHVLGEELDKSEFDGRVSMFVSHMMDLGPVFHQMPMVGKDGQYVSETHLDGTLRDFQTTQLTKALKFDRDFKGKYIHFVAFNPFPRPDHPEDVSDIHESVRFVASAIERGAWGVKFYPPSGYRPTENFRPSRPWLSPKLREQWDGRYKDRTAEQLDEITLELFRWCVAHDVPVLAHCSDGEFQATGGYGKEMPDPKYWADLLKNHPELQKLRLCLAHAGGEDYWFGGGLDSAWGQTVLELCRKYPNVYCDVGCFEKILDPQYSLDAKIANRLVDCFNLPVDGDHRCRFGDKIMYGSDWYMPMNANPRTAYLDAWEKVFSTPQLSRYYRKFFCQNALNYLQLEKRMNSNVNADGAMREKWRSLIRESKG